MIWKGEPSLLKGPHDINTPDILAFSRWTMVLIVVLLGIQAHAHWLSFYTILGILFLGEASFSTIQVMTRTFSKSPWYARFATAEAIAITGLLYMTGDFSQWYLYIWCITSTTLSSRSRSGFLMTLGIDILSIFLIVARIHNFDIQVKWFAIVGFFTFTAIPLIYLSYSHGRQQRELEQQLDAYRRQTKRVQELELIASQMTDYTMDVQNRAVIDQLTGLYNQTVFHHRLLIEVEKARQTGSLISLILFDIDHFKSFNDQFGHFLGDDVLRSVANVLHDASKNDSYIIGRIGGEEMCIAMPDVTLEQARNHADRIREDVANIIISGPEGPLRVTVSAGVASFPAMAKDARELTKCADFAMYRAKESGRNKTIIYENSISS